MYNKTKDIDIMSSNCIDRSMKQSVEKVCPGAKIQVLKGTDKKKTDALDESKDFFIMNALNVAKKGHQYFIVLGLLLLMRFMLWLQKNYLKHLFCPTLFDWFIRNSI